MGKTTKVVDRIAEIKKLMSKDELDTALRYRDLIVTEICSNKSASYEKMKTTSYSVMTNVYGLISDESLDIIKEFLIEFFKKHNYSAEIKYTNMTPQLRPLIAMKLDITLTEIDNSRATIITNMEKDILDDEYGVKIKTANETYDITQNEVDKKIITYELTEISKKIDKACSLRQYNIEYKIKSLKPTETNYRKIVYIIQDKLEKLGYGVTVYDDHIMDGDFTLGIGWNFNNNLKCFKLM